MTTCRSDTTGRGADYRVALWSALACALLSACAAPEGGGLGGLGFASTQSGERREATLAGGDMRLVPPSGYCIEPRSLKNTAAESFALVASCRDRARGTRGYATFVVGPALAEAMTPEEILRAVVGPETEISDEDSLAVAALSEAGPDPERLSWRGAAFVAGHPVLVSVYAVDARLAGPGGAELLRALAGGLEASGPQLAAAAPSQ